MDCDCEHGFAQLLLTSHLTFSTKEHIQVTILPRCTNLLPTFQNLNETPNTRYNAKQTHCCQLIHCTTDSNLLSFFVHICCILCVFTFSADNFITFYPSDVFTNPESV